MIIIGVDITPSAWGRDPGSFEFIHLSVSFDRCRLRVKLADIGPNVR